MKVWIITIYEPLPLLNPNVRPMRWGMMIEALANAGHQVELWTSSFDHISHRYHKNESCYEIVNSDVAVQYLHGSGYQSDVSIKRLLHFKQMANTFTRIANLKAIKPDLIITQIPSLELAEAVIDFGKMKSIPVIVDVRDLWPDGYLRWLPKPLQSWALWILWTERKRVHKILKNAAAITAISKAYLDWSVRHAGRNISAVDRVFYLGYPTSMPLQSKSEAEIIRKDFRKRHSIGDDDFVLLFSGTFCGSYDLATVIAAARRVSTVLGAKVRIVIAGKGENEIRLQKKAKGCVSVIFTGWLNANELGEALLAADVGLAPYSKRAMMSLPNKPFEYMAAGLPVINSLKGELWSLVENNQIGKSYNSGDAEQLYNIICWFAAHRKETVEMGSKARVLFEKHFSSKKIYPDFVTYLETIVSHNKMLVFGMA